MHCKWCAGTRMCALKWCAVHSYQHQDTLYCTPGYMHCERCVVHSYQHQDTLYCKWCEHQDACTVSGVSYTHTSTRIHCTVSGVPAPGCMHCERCVVHSYQHQDTLYCKWCASTRMHALWAVCRTLIPAPGYMYCLCMHDK